MTTEMNVETSGKEHSAKTETAENYQGFFSDHLSPKVASKIPLGVHRSPGARRRSDDFGFA